MEAVADFGGDGAQAEERLGPEPEEKGERDEAEAQEPETPGRGERLANSCFKLWWWIAKVKRHEGSLGET